MVLRSLLLALIIGSAAVSSFAQFPVPPGPGGMVSERAIFFRGPGQPPEEVITGVQQTLKLTDTQVSALKALLNVRMETTNGIFQELGEKQRSLQEIMAQTNPSALDIGNAFLAVQGAQARLRATEQKFQTDFDALLAPDQRTTIQNLKTASSQIEALRGLGVFGNENRFEFALPATGMVPGMMPGMMPGMGGGERDRVFGPVPIPGPNSGGRIIVNPRGR